MVSVHSVLFSLDVDFIFTTPSFPEMIALFYLANGLCQPVIKVLQLSQEETFMKIEQKQLLKAWRDELGVMMRMHYMLSAKIRLMNYILGVPTIIIAMLVASYIFFTINQDT